MALIVGVTSGRPAYGHGAQLVPLIRACAVGEGRTTSDARQVAVCIELVGFRRAVGDG